ncbi:MAG: TrmB family transcriptional regulator [Methanomassiliicoccus sp.]|nr:TrmB family transcriptional regulator [Methanomassiliicoccus sp.]
MRLGLSEYESRAYVATVALGEGTVKEISVESGVPRSRAYDVMERLAERGFVQVSNSTPICYRANDPLIASQNLMEEIKHANDEIVKELNEINRKADKVENPVWTLMGQYSIHHKISELLNTAKDNIIFICFNNRNVIKYAKLLADRSKVIPVSVVLVQKAESFAGHLGKATIMRLVPKDPPGEWEGEMTDQGFVTGDSSYCIELLLLVDNESTLVLTKEEDAHRAIVITGTVMSLLSRETAKIILGLSEEVDASPNNTKKNFG